MKLIIAGSRDITDPAELHRALHDFDFKIKDITEVVCGGARGVDRLGADFAKQLGIPVKYFIPDWDKDGKVAGIWRNEDMARYADALLAVWDGKSKGTKHMIDTMKKYNKPVWVYQD